MDLHSLVLNNQQIFWDIPNNKLNQLSTEAIVERIVNYGDITAFKELTNIISHSDLVQIVASESQKPRQNYRPKALNFLKNYLEFN